ncbi:transcriptional regulator, HxlR family [Roseivivax lentus]|uniref:Transcriptional regulator, HxlR family n=1 Tax=Roseivivax lentus TaxID=633194 RepID=A0A1N7NF60_9RHOB|nr:helix-turn-helix domain-containing protein [Roseivivax lentus]SIS96946.1 transcriptional regulator, HxlR family [Roseivivax lentus]
MKTYNQFCGTAYALDVLGERWTLLILRDLLAGPRRYGDLLEGLPGITTNLLAKRLAHLTDAQLIAKCTGGYELTERGRKVEPIVLALADFGSQSLRLPPRHDETVSRRALVLNLKRRYRGGCDCTIGLVFETASFLLTITETSLDIGPLNIVPDATLTHSNGGLARWIIAGDPIDDLIKTGDVTVEGRADCVRAFDARLDRP